MISRLFLAWILAASLELMRGLPGSSDSTKKVPSGLAAVEYAMVSRVKVEMRKIC